MPLDPLEIFLRQARIRWLVCAFVETAAVGLLAGCLAAIVLLPVLIWRGENGGLLALALPALGTVIGCVAALRHRPSLAAIATLADQRFETDDLLATALAVAPATDPWTRVIHQLACQRILPLKPSALITPRLGPRTWSAISLALLVTLTLGAFSMDFPQSPASAASADDLADLAQAPSPPDTSLSPRPAAREARAETTPDSRAFPGENDAPATGENRSPSHGHADGNQALDATGAGTAHTADAQPRSDRIDESRSPTASPSATPAAGTRTATGNGPQSPSPGGDQTATGIVTPPAANSTPRDNLAGSPAAQIAPSPSAHTSAVPDAYRDLVRDYFDGSR
jgi:hypothetical protein